MDSKWFDVSCNIDFKYNFSVILVRVRVNESRELCIRLFKKNKK